MVLFLEEQLQSLITSLNFMFLGFKGQFPSHSDEIFKKPFAA